MAVYDTPYDPSNPLTPNVPPIDPSTLPSNGAPTVGLTPPPTPAPIPGATAAPVTTLGTPSWQGGGWSTAGTGNTLLNYIQGAFNAGLRGQALVDYVNGVASKTGESALQGLAYDPNRNVYELPNGPGMQFGGYISANPTNPNQFDLVTKSTPDSAGTIGIGGASGAINPAYLTPFTDTFSAPAASALTAFKPPTAADILNDPSYQFRLGQGEQALEASASARGLLNSGGTLADILKFGQDYASQEYGNVYNRDLATTEANNQTAQSLYQRAVDQFNTARDIFYANQSNPFNKILSVASLGANTALQGG